MLVLGRQIGESVVLRTTEPLPAGAVIRVYLSDVTPELKAARLSFDAPRSVNIVRAELEHGGNPAPEGNRPAAGGTDAPTTQEGV